MITHLDSSPYHSFNSSSHFFPHNLEIIPFVFFLNPLSLLSAASMHVAIEPAGAIFRRQNIAVAFLT